MESATNPGIKTSEFWTAMLSQVVGLLLASGVITSGQASAVNGQAPLIGGIILCVVTAVSYIANRFFLKMRLGPVPKFSPVPPASGAPALNGPRSPSYAPPSTGPAPSALPEHLKGAV